MDTVGEHIARAQASGDLQEVRSALKDALVAGAEPAQVEQALAEVERIEQTKANALAAGATAASATGADAGAAAAAGAAVVDAADAEARANERARAAAEEHKKRGNEHLKDGAKSKTAMREALECFTRGVEVRCSDLVLNAQLHSNRAHVRILLRQFVEAVDDCRKAIELDPNNLKAYWRAAKASLHLDLCRNGVGFCEAGLQRGPSDADLLRLRDACAERLAGQQQRRSSGQVAAAPSAGQLGDFNADEAMAVQEKVSSLNEQIDALQHAISTKQREKVKCQLTRGNLSDTPAGTRLYCSVGRCFMQQERAAIDESLSHAIDNFEVDLPKLSKTHQELEKRKEAAEKELQEMVRVIRQQQQGAG